MNNHIPLFDLAICPLRPPVENDPRSQGLTKRGGRASDVTSKDGHIDTVVSLFCTDSTVVYHQIPTIGSSQW
ncbi:hypothetical protein [Absidia glauca]|uniref:Uncharacterized protein n=1 Tax=Absidia glauca TaxID=4829 RepID=A0A163J9N6_ABSGL|nr:hypothetical protein [Absidia glauca]